MEMEDARRHVKIRVAESDSRMRSQKGHSTSRKDGHREYENLNRGRDDRTTRRPEPPGFTSGPVLSARRTSTPINSVHRSPGPHYRGVDHCSPISDNDDQITLGQEPPGFTSGPVLIDTSTPINSTRRSPSPHHRGGHHSSSTSTRRHSTHGDYDDQPRDRDPRVPRPSRNLYSTSTPTHHRSESTSSRTSGPSPVIWGPHVNAPILPHPDNAEEIYEWVNSLNRNKPVVPSSSSAPYETSSSSSSKHHSSKHRYRERESYYHSASSHSHGHSRGHSSRSHVKDKHSSHKSRRPDDYSFRSSSLREAGVLDRRYISTESSRTKPNGFESNPITSSSKRKRSTSPRDFRPDGRYKVRERERPFTRKYEGSKSSLVSRSRSVDRSRERRDRGRDITKKPHSENRHERRENPWSSSRYSKSRDESHHSLPRSDVTKAPPKSELSDIDLDSDLTLTSEEEKEEEEDLSIEKWVRSAPAELYYERLQNGEMSATKRAINCCGKFENNILLKAQRKRLEAEEEGRTAMQVQKSKECGGVEKDEDESDSYSEDSSDDEKESRKSHAANRELEKRKKHPKRLHEEMWHNEPGLMNDGPVCRCSAKARRFGIRHGFYPGESPIPKCNPFTNNSNRLHHYRINISPAKNFLVNTPTTITHDHQEYIFEGFSIFSHYPLDLQLPPCRVIRFNIRYDVFVEKEKFPESFCVQELLLFESYIFNEILELVDLKYHRSQNACSEFHLMPRFVRQLPDNGKEILSMNTVLKYLLESDKELVKKEKLKHVFSIPQKDWQNFADKHKGTIVTKWGMKPSSFRVDQIDRNVDTQESEDQPTKLAAKTSTDPVEEGDIIVVNSHRPESKSSKEPLPFPLIIHFGIRPPQLSYAGNSEYQRAWRRYVKYRHLLSNMAKPSTDDKNKLSAKELKLQQMRTASSMKRDVTIAISSEGFRSTGICCDIVQHSMLLPVLIGHLRFHRGLAQLESKMEYTFKNRSLLQLAMTHPSYRENFGTNPDHARNALTNCGIRQPEYGDRRIHYASTRKRGINTLINIMARFGAEEETESEITHNERLEFLGDAVVEFITSIHLFHMFPNLEEGGLATYRAAIVQNQHLAVLAQVLELDQYMLYAHGSDLCHDSELRHAMANCFEALMGAIFIDGGIEQADKILAKALFGSEPENFDIWTNYKRHPLQIAEPKGDRDWVKSHKVLEKLKEFEKSIGVEFTHIRLLARAFTDRSLGYNNLTLGSNQRLEFLGDTVLQLISSEYLYRHFPDHHEGHLSLLRSSLVNNRTQSLVCDDLGMCAYSMRSDPKSEMKTKDRADLLEAFLGALYIDKGLKYCIRFCSVCFIPRLSKSIIKQEWNDPKSKLQQCCLTLRAMDGREPDIPVYKVIGCKGPTNSRTYTLAVSFRGQRLAKAKGHSIQEAEMNSAEKALRKSADLFPQLHHQKRIVGRMVGKV